MARSSGRKGFRGLFVATAAILAGALPLSALAQPSDQAVSGRVVPIDWDAFDGGPPDDAQAERVRELLLNGNAYALGPWYDDKFGDQTGDYLDLGGNEETHIRPVAGEALALATSLSTAAFDADVVGFPVEHARDVAVRLLTSVAYHHKANEQGGWGDHWQSALWAYDTGFAGWLMWDELTADDQARLEQMVVYEAERFLRYEVPYYRNAAGDVVSPGDTKAEENAWNAALLNLAAAMVPAHPHGTIWQDKAIELMVSAYSRTSDLRNDAEINGKPVRDWLDGTNIDNDGTLVNHEIHPNPDYATSINNNFDAALVHSFAGQPTPQAAFFNADLVYESLVDLEFEDGTIYVRDEDGAATADIYFPSGTDGGANRRVHYLLLDAQMDLFGLDGTVSVPAAEWAREHAIYALDTDQRGARQVARTYLTHWVAHHDAVETSNQAYPIRPNLALGAETEVSSVRNSATGGEQAVDGQLTDDSRWMTATSDPTPSIVVDLGAAADLTDIHVFSGNRAERHPAWSTLKDFTVEVHTADGWQQVADIVDNVDHEVAVNDLDINGDQVRLSISRPSDSSTPIARVFEIEVYGTT